MKIFTAARSILLPFVPLWTLIFGDDLETELPVGVTDDDPVRLFIQAGQSNCGGAASSALLNDDSGTYPDLVGTIDGAWFAGEYEKGNVLIRPMLAGEAKDGKFGPEVSMSQRIVEASESVSPTVMITKYCWGGSNIKTEWNPETSDNNWDRDADDGTSAWLVDNGVSVANSKTHLYANLVYTVRKTTELLEEAGIPFDYSGFFFIQGSADKKSSTWDEYAADTVLLFETLRSDLNEPSLPIVDHGGLPHHNIMTGKQVAAATISNGNAFTSEYQLGVANPDDCCVPGPSDPCLGSSFPNFDVQEHYGYDPQYPDDLKPEGFTDKEFYWFKDYPNDQHFEYEGMILRGQMLANTFLRETKPEWATNMTAAMEENDPAVLFPLKVCPPGEKPTAENVCYMDQSKETTPVSDLECSDESRPMNHLLQWLLGPLMLIIQLLTSFFG